MEKLLKLIMCHLLGDYVLQIDFIAKSKGNNIYHLLVHCILYIFPFYIMFGFDSRLISILISHIIIDLFKARYKKINYIADQILHYIALIVFYLV